MADEIRRGGGNEVFFVGRPMQGILTQVEVLARGNRDSVPALLQVPNPGDIVLHNHPSGELEPSAADVAIASRLGNNSVAFYIVDNNVERVYPVVKAFVRRDVQKLASRDLSAALRPGGPLASSLTVEDRPGQHAMLEAVANSFNRGDVALLEAGTGTGKTLAYLLPALDWAIKNKQRVLVATHTINLQEQIINKDAPALRAVFGEDFRVVLVKGRSNYISKRRVLEFEQSLPMLVDDTETAEAKALIEWAHKTEDGSRSDLAVQPKHELWERIQSETDNCLRHRCPTFNSCFFFRARRAALEADLMVANHHMLFADLSVRAKMDTDDGGLLPAYKHVVIDEAHHVEEVATQYFGQDATRLGFQRALHRMLRETPRGEKGSLPVLQRRLMENAAKLPDGFAKMLNDILQIDVRPAHALAEGSFQRMYDAAHLLARQGESDGGGEVRTLRLVGDVYEREEVLDLQRFAQVAIKDLQMLNEPCSRFLRKASSFADEAGILGPLKEFQSALERLIAHGDAAHECLLSDKPGTVRWIETKAYNPRVVHLTTAPVDVGGLLAEHLFKGHETVVMTSATLAVAGEMSFLKKRTGLTFVERERIQERQFASPFDYADQARLLITDDLPSPDQQGYEEALGRDLGKLLLAAGGRAFVLFTSFRSLQRQYQLAAPMLAEYGIRCLKQGETTRDRLLRAFREDTRSVLFGTDSFWEGVDVEGESLSTVILTRLPFRVPTEPVTIARAEAIEKAGGRAFTEYTIPTAVIKFRQGFGRLIRSRTDRGVVIVTDKRLVSKPYGRAFLESLPPAPLIVGPVREIEDHVKRFFNE
jgi:ATP-dependent DNA helicase DinG